MPPGVTTDASVVPSLHASECSLLINNAHQGKQLEGELEKYFYILRTRHRWLYMKFLRVFAAVCLQPERYCSDRLFPRHYRWEVSGALWMRVKSTKSEAR
jgi:hypothetical protein